jgi:hypothetical protein
VCVCVYKNILVWDCTEKQMTLYRAHTRGQKERAVNFIELKNRIGS